MYLILSLVWALAATIAVSLPTSQERREARIARRAPIRDMQTSPPNVTDVFSQSTSDNWAGAILSEAPGTFTTVTASFIVPIPSIPEGGDPDTAYSASIWVGIDGVSCQNAILQTGIDTTIQNGQVTYDAWWEWFPFAAADFPAEDISVSAGDILTVSVTATSATSGTAEIINQSTAMAVVEDIATSPIALCMSDAEWIVEDFSVGGTLVPLANFGTVTFTGASAGTPSGSVDTSSANTVIINQNNVDLTSALISGSTVMVAYI